MEEALEVGRKATRELPSKPCMDDHKFWTLFELYWFDYYNSLVSFQKFSIGIKLNSN
jgi:hypothetical protein